MQKLIPFQADGHVWHVDQAVRAVPEHSQLCATAPMVGCGPADGGTAGGRGEGGTVGVEEGPGAIQSADEERRAVCCLLIADH